MKNQPTTLKQDALSRLLRVPFLAGMLPAFLLLLTFQSSDAGSATWNLNPTSGDWNTATNWTPATVPNGPADTATFDVSSTTTVFTSVGADTEVNGIVFNPGASAFTITTSPLPNSTTFIISGVGITNNSGITQNFVTAVDGVGIPGYIQFSGSATAGTLTAFTNDSGIGSIAGLMVFFDTSSAGNGTFTNNGGVAHGYGGETSFNGTSTAAHGTFTNNGGNAIGGITQFLGTSNAGEGTFTNNGGAVSGDDGGQTNFFDTSTADNGTFIANGGAVSGAAGGAMYFSGSSTASNSTLIANGGLGGGLGGLIGMRDASTGGTTRVEVFDNGELEIFYHSVPGVTIGSIEGSGAVFLGAFNLTVGSNNLSTTFSGLIQDGGIGGGTGGSLRKTHAGTLTLTHANTYTGGTIIEGGKLVVNNMSGSGTGTGAVQLNAGTLGGGGTIAGAVTVGTGGGAGAVLAPGRRGGKPGTPLTIQSTLTFNSDATYNCGLNTKGAIADQVVANGVTISGAQFTLVDRGRLALTPGTVFTVIDNTAGAPIAGTFSNLADGSTLVGHGNTFQVSYEGGDGNDLTLTVQ